MLFDVLKAIITKFICKSVPTKINSKLREQKCCKDLAEDSKYPKVNLKAPVQVEFRF